MKITANDLKNTDKPYIASVLCFVFMFYQLKHFFFLFGYSDS